MQLFSGDAILFLKKVKKQFGLEKLKKFALKCFIIGPIYFSIVNWPKASSNLNFSSIKIAHCVQLM